MRRKLLLIPLIFLLSLISLVAAGQKLPLRFPDGYKWRSRGIHPKLVGKGEFKLLTRRAPTQKLTWKTGYTNRG